MTNRRDHVLRLLEKERRNLVKQQSSFERTRKAWEAGHKHIDRKAYPLAPRTINFSVV